jgi:iron complex transport system ATP-binding protein
MIRVSKLGKSYSGARVLHDIDFEVACGEFVGIVGPNGSGKSTLIGLLSAVERMDEGEIWLDGKPLSSYTRKSLARVMAVLQQGAIPPIAFTVRDVVEMGRYPHQTWFGNEPGESDALISSILDSLGLAALATRPVSQLSGGERQRVALAMTIAQQPKVLLLDEPTTYLDIGHQIMLMDRIRHWQQETGMTVVAVLHDLNLASLYCDRLVMLAGGRIVATGTPREIVRAELIRKVYGVMPTIIEHPVGKHPQMMLSPLSGGMKEQGRWH